MAWGPSLKAQPPYIFGAGRVDSTVSEVVNDLNYLDNNNIRSLAQGATDTYSADLQSAVFPDEMVHFVTFARCRGCSSPSDLATLMYTEELHDTFPNVSIALRMFMCLAVSNCSSERSFSQSNGVYKEQVMQHYDR